MDSSNGQVEWTIQTNIIFWGLVVVLPVVITVLLMVWALHRARKAEQQRNLQEAAASDYHVDPECPKLQQAPPIIILHPDNQMVLARKLCGEEDLGQIAHGSHQQVQENKVQKNAVQDGEGLLLHSYEAALPPQL